MITKNFKNVLALLLEQSAGGIGCLPVRNTSGARYYAKPYFNASYIFPGTCYYDCRLNDDPGIWFGSGQTAATEDDYSLESKITSGLTFNLSRVNDIDENENPFIRFDIMVTNVSAANITISELGYTQYAQCSTTLRGSDNVRIVTLFDRTVLATPVTIEPNGYAVIRYILKTIISNGS
jgi:hypothetical protein